MVRNFITLVLLLLRCVAVIPATCTDGQCGQGGHCVPAANEQGGSCVCYVGFEGTDCHDRDECHETTSINNLCYNGTCVNTVGSFLCKCNVGFTGTHCTDELNPCASSPCGNGGICSRSQNATYTCRCLNGFQPPDCLDRNECELSQTICNHGSCINTLGSYRCVCIDGYIGDHCNIPTPCSTKPCGDRGECMVSGSTYNCSCYVGFEGTTCSIDRNECSIDPDVCTNGNCINTPGSFRCSCHKGFTGHDCRTLDLCVASSNPCSAHGNCVMSNGVAVCNCDDGYTGSLCGTKLLTSLSTTLLPITHPSSSTVRTSKLSTEVDSTTSSITRQASSTMHITMTPSTQQSTVQSSTTFSLGSASPTSSVTISLSGKTSRISTNHNRPTSLTPQRTTSVGSFSEKTTGKNKSWISSNWYIVVAGGLVICLCVAVGLIYRSWKRRAQMRYKKFHNSPMSSTPVTESISLENPLYPTYMELRGASEGISDT